MGYPSASRFGQVSGYIKNYLPHTDCPSILEFGDQTLVLRAEQLDYIRKFLIEYGAGSKYKKYEGRVGEQIYVSEVYRDAGIRHKCLDLNEKNNAIPIDLNIWPTGQIHEDYFQGFDLILNFGTTEHVGNQINAFAIVHYLSRQGGVILHHIPMLHYSNHAMAVITPKFIKKLIDWNGYEILESRWANHVINQSISFHFDASLCYIDNFKEAISESTHAAIGTLVFRNVNAGLFVPPLDVDVQGESERKLFNSYIKHYAHPLLADSSEQRVERVFELESNTQKRIEEKKPDTRYKGRKAYLHSEIDSTLTIKHSEDKRHFFEITTKPVGVGGQNADTMPAGCAMKSRSDVADQSLSRAEEVGRVGHMSKIAHKLTARLGRRVKQPKVYKHASETTAADSDTLVQKAEKLDAELQSVTAECKDYKHAFETTAADRDRLARELETYRHAFETTAADRDRLAALVEPRAVKTSADRGRLAAPAEPLAVKHDQMLLGLISHVFRQEVNVAPDAMRQRLLAALETLPLQSELGETEDGDRLVEAAACGLLDIAEVVLRLAYVSEQGLDMVELSRELDPRFPSQFHAIDLYFRKRKSFVEHVNFYDEAIRNGLWPDEGTRAAQAAAIERGLPSILLVTMPKSASVFIWTTIASSLKMPMFKVAHSKQFADEALIPSLLDVFAKGGMTAQHHITPTKSNIETLKKAGLTKFLLHIRDPRQAAVSWWHYTKKIGGARERKRSQREIEDVLWRKYLEVASKWLHGWLDIADNDSDLQVVLSAHEQMSGREREHITALLQELDVPPGLIDLQLSERTGKTHFRKGAKDEWLNFFTDEFKQRSTELIPNTLASRFGWQEIS